MTGGELIAMGRARAGLTQRVLADRLGVSQAQLSRLEAGRREPSFVFVQRAARACDLEASVRLTAADGSLDELVAQQLRRTPAERLEALLAPTDLAGVLGSLSVAGELGGILVGAVAAVLHGGPGVLPLGRLELTPDDLHATVTLLEAAGWLASLPEDPFGGLHARWHWFAPEPSVWDIELVDVPAGTNGYVDIEQRAETLDGVPVAVAGALDLLRIAHASPWPADRARAVELDALLEQRRRPAAAPA